MDHSLWLPLIECVVIALAAGLVFGIFGSGSGLLMTPGYYYIIRHFAMAHNHKMQMAVATTAAASAILGFFSAHVQYKKGNFDKKVAKQLMLGLLLGTIVAVSLLNFIPSDVLKRLFGVVVILVAIWFIRYRMDLDTKHWSLFGCRNFILNFCMGLLWFLLGVAVFIAPYLHKCGIDMRRCIGCASFIAAFFSLIAAILFMFSGSLVIGVSWMHVGYVNLFIVVVSLVPGIIGGYLGSHLSTRLPQRYLKKIYAGLIFIVGALMIA